MAVGGGKEGEGDMEGKKEVKEGGREGREEGGTEGGRDRGREWPELAEPKPSIQEALGFTLSTPWGRLLVHPCQPITRVTETEGSGVQEFKLILCHIGSLKPT